MALPICFDQFLKRKPSVHELYEHVRVGTNWHKLGVLLKLDVTKLNEIRSLNEDSDFKSLKMFELWLSSKPNATRREIIETLKKPAISENAIAEEYKKMLPEIQKEVATLLLQKHSESFSQLILPSDIVDILYKEEVISKETFDEVKQSSRLTDGPLGALSGTVSEDPNKLRVFSSVLLQSEETIHVGQVILKEYDENFPQVPVCPSQSDISTLDTTSTSINQSTITELYLPPSFQYDFDRMRTKFGNLVHSVAPLIKSAIINSPPSPEPPLSQQEFSSPLKELKKYLQRCFRELKPQLSTAESFDDVMDLVEEKCTIINVACLEAVIDHYNIKEAKDHIATYKSAVEKFCEDVKLSVLSSENFMIGSSTLLKCETIEFILEWKADEHTLSEIQDLLWKAFGGMAKRVLVTKVREGNSIIVTCYAPRHMMDILQMEAEKNLDPLIKLGLLKLTMGYHVIWDMRKREKEVKALEEKVISKEIGKPKSFPKVYANMDREQQDQSSTDSLFDRSSLCVLPSKVTDTSIFSKLAGGFKSVIELPFTEENLEPVNSILHKYSERLSCVVLSVEVVQLLYIENVISKELYNNVLQSGCLLTNDLLTALHTTVLKDPSQLRVFVSILLHSKKTVLIANEILNDYLQISQQTYVPHTQLSQREFRADENSAPSFATRHQCTMTDTTEEVENDKNIKEPSGVHSFESLWQAFGILINTIRSLIAKDVSLLKDLKSHLQQSYRELKPQLAHAKSFDDVITIIVEKYNVINVDCLEAVVDHLEVTEAEAHLSSYKITVDTFCKEIALSMCFNESFISVSSPPLLFSETVQLTLRCKVDKCKLHDVQVLLSKLFRDTHNRVYIAGIRKDDFITVICYAPQYIVGVLLIEADKNREVMEKLEVVRLKIGYVTVYDKLEDFVKISMIQSVDATDNVKESDEGKLLSEEKLKGFESKFEMMNKMINAQIREISLLKQKDEEQKVQLEEKEKTIHKLEENSKAKLEEAKTEASKLLESFNSQLEEQFMTINELTETLEGKLQKTEKETDESLKSLISQLQEKDKEINELTKNMEGTCPPPTQQTPGNQSKQYDNPQEYPENLTDPQPGINITYISSKPSPKENISISLKDLPDPSPPPVKEVPFRSFQRKGTSSFKYTTTNICRHCYEKSPNDPSLLELICRSSSEHNQHDKILVTEDFGTLVKIRPLPRDFRPSGFFTKCYDGTSCKFFPKCTYAHSDAEKHVWNSWLMDERKLGPTKSQPSASHIPQTTPIKNTHRERQKNPPLVEHMMLPVQLRCYKQKYRALLYYEEEEHVQVLHAKCDGQYKLVPVRQQDIPSHRKPIEYYSFYGYIEGMTASQVAYALQASGDRVVLTILNRPEVQYNAFLLRCNYETANENLYIGFLETKIASLLVSKLNVYVNFEVKFSYFDDLNNTLSRIPENALKRIIPNKEDFSEGLDLRRIPKPQYSQLKLDDSQFRGLQTMLFSRSSAPVLIPGPFGSGKTRLLAVATEEIIRDCKEKKVFGRVLICCHHQHSADLFVNQYFSKMLENKENPWDVEVVRVTSNRYNTDIKYFLNTANFKQSFGKYEAKQYLVVITTFGGALRISEVIPQDFFTHILIDEGAQTREPETIAPLIMANDHTRIVIAGDIQQVSPKLVVLGEGPQRHGLGVSLIERLHSQYKAFGSIGHNYVVSLNCNYRCHVDLMELCSSLFYDPPLVSRADVKCHPSSPYPLKFICSSFSNIIPTNPENRNEATLILDEVKEALKYGDWDVGDVCIMAPSLNQVNLIRRMIYGTRDYDRLRRVNIRSTYQMQGQEYSLLFISTIESLEPSGRPFDALKSVCHPAVFNTVITRSKSLVVAVGNPLVLMMSEATMDESKWCWREFITRCMIKKTFIVPPHLNYDKVKNQFQRMWSSRKCNEIMTLFRDESGKA